MTPSIYVDRVVRVGRWRAMSLSKQEMAAAVARDIPPSSYVSLGIGQPTLVADLPSGSGVVLHRERDAQHGARGCRRPGRRTSPTPASSR